jgi:hypothetical protein
MPRGDRTGPEGLGPMTGRAAGFCAGYPTPGYMNPGWGRGRGRGFGFFGRGGGRGRRNWFYATGLPGWQRMAQGLPAFGWQGGSPYGTEPQASGWTVKEEKDALKSEIGFLKAQLKSFEKRMEELEKEEQ